MDSGISWQAFRGAPGGDDYHRLWINPVDNNVILLASDQGATIKANGEITWSSWYNQPTAAFYHASTYNAFPYNFYGGQQESGTVGISSRGNDGQITLREWHPVGVEEYGYVAAGNILDNTEMPPTTQVIKTFAETQEVYKNTWSAWTNIKNKEISDVNVRLKIDGVDILKF